MDTYDFLSDPRTPTLEERRELHDRLLREQQMWLHRLRHLAEGAPPEDDFPAFLLATQPFADLATRLGRASSRGDLDAAAADELDWFLRAFADYLRTQDGEDVFAEPRRRTG
ncbi:MAG: hypothetical protein H6835_13630 [Planctomycetes bacterium]|nr:hypothetical protein [Planctomycetota bacterium]